MVITDHVSLFASMLYCVGLLHVVWGWFMLGGSASC